MNWREQRGPRGSWQGVGDKLAALSRTRGVRLDLHVFRKNSLCARGISWNRPASPGVFLFWYRSVTYDFDQAASRTGAKCTEIVEVLLMIATVVGSRGLPKEVPGEFS